MALPVFSVDTVEEARDFEVWCIHMYDGRKRWTPGVGGWEPGNVESLQGVTDFMREQWERAKRREQENGQQADAPKGEGQ